jgi:hypothetical protein
MAREHTFKSAWGIDWELTGDILDRIDIYDHVETVTGVDEKGREWEGSGLVSCGDLVEVDDAELIELSGPSIVQPPHVSTEIDLDRDVPTGEIEWDGCGPSAGSYPGWEGWNVWDKETEDGDIVLTINPNNTEQPDQFDLDAYCDANPDFNDAMNGHYKDDYTGFNSFLQKNLIA